MEALRAGEVTGAGSFRCGTCGFAIALHELDEAPECPHCRTGEWERASIFDAQHDTDPWTGPPAERPDWLDQARGALVTAGSYVAFEENDRVRVLQLQPGWTRVGRSMAAHIRFDDPTVSRRHALLHCDDGSLRVLDDRSLNGVCVNGERVEWHELADGDEIAIGRFHLYVLRLSADELAGSPPASQAQA